MPRMLIAQRCAIRAAPSKETSAAFLSALLVSVVAGSGEALQVTPIEELSAVSSMWVDVVDYRGDCFRVPTPVMRALAQRMAP